MLPKDLRLKENRQINKTFKNGLHKKSDHFFYKYIKSQNPLKFCITAAKKHKLNKPQRNKFKRQISHAIYNSLSIKPEIKNLNFNIIIVLHTIPKGKDYYKTMKLEIKNFLNKLQNEQ
jgi:ribonuclease P protein component